MSDQSWFSHSLWCLSTVCGHITSQQPIRTTWWVVTLTSVSQVFLSFFKWPWIECSLYNAETQRHRRWAPVDWPFIQYLSSATKHWLYAFQYIFCNKCTSQNLNANLRAHTHSLASFVPFVQIATWVKLIHCFEKELFSVPCNDAVNKGKWWQRCSGKSVMVSARCSCQNVLVANQRDDAEGTKTIRGNYCCDKQAGFVVFFCMFGFYMTGCCFGYFTQMYCLRPSLKMLHEIF